MADSPPWAVPQDVRDRWLGGDPLTVTDDQLLTLIADTEDTILREFPELPERIDADPEAVANAIPLARVKKVVARIAIRHLLNPEGQRSRMDVAGSFTQNVMFGGDNPGSVYLTDEDRAELGGVLTGSAFTIDQTPQSPTPTSPEGWLAYGRTWVP